MPTIMLCKMDKQVSYSQQPAKITKSNYKNIKIKDLGAKEMKARFPPIAFQLITFWPLMTETYKT